MCIERNRDILFGRGGEKLRLTVTSATAAAMQLVLPNPTTLAIPATAGLVHGPLTLPQGERVLPLVRPYD
jgi:hypothetical protein